jgi:tetratricopeptide (TPR) repeat protein
MRYFFFLIILYFIQFSSVLKAQTADTVLVNTLNQQAAQAYLEEPYKTQEIAKEALSLAKKINYPKGIAEAYFNQSLVYKLRGKYEEEMNLHLESIKIYQQLNDSVSIAKIYVSIGSLFIQAALQGDVTLPRKAVEYYQKALSIYRNHQNLSGEALVLRRIGNVFLEEKKYDEAIRYYQMALKIEEKLKDELEIANLQNNIGFVLYEKKLYPQAMAYYQKSFETLVKKHNVNRLSASYYNMGRVYLAQNQVDKAIELGQKSLAITEKHQIIFGNREAFALLSDCYTQKGEFEKALHYYKKLMQINDSIWSYESVKKIIPLQNLYEKQNQEQQLKIWQKDKAIANLWFFGGVSSLGIVLIISTLIIYSQNTKIKKNRKILQQKEELHQIQQTLKETELENQTLKNNQLQQNIEFKNKELTTFTLNFAQKNNLIQEIKQGMLEIAKQNSNENKIKINRLVNLIDLNLKNEDDWDDFKLYFEQIHTEFFENLKNDYNELTSSELRLCALTRLNMSTKEIAEVLGISPQSVRMARHRLRKKFNLATDDNLLDLILKY